MQPQKCSNIMVRQAFKSIGLGQTSNLHGKSFGTAEPSFIAESGKAYVSID